MENSKVYKRVVTLFFSGDATVDDCLEASREYQVPLGWWRSDFKGSRHANVVAVEITDEVLNPVPVVIEHEVGGEG